MAKMYKIFVAYMYKTEDGRTGFANAFVNTNAYPLTKINIKELEEKIRIEHSVPVAIILNFIKLAD